MIFYLLGGILEILGVIILVPIIVALYYHEQTIFVFLSTGLGSIILGRIIKIIFKKDLNNNVKLKDFMVFSASAWLLASLIGAIPFLTIPYFNYLDSVYESMSAWTTTGMTLINNVEILPKSILFCRSLEQWIGGVGILVFSAGILTRGGYLTNLLYISEARQEKIYPSSLHTIESIIWIYLFYTIIGILLLHLTGMPLFDAINLCFTGIATGGMSIKNDSFPYSDLSKIVMIIIMLIGGVISFQVHHKILTGRLFKDIQTKYALIVIFIISAIIFLYDKIDFIDSLFTVVSALTSTGFTTINITTLSNFSLFLLIFIMLIGGGAGTTTGGVKIIRFLILLKVVYYEIKRVFYPKSAVIYEELAGKKIDKQVVRDAITLFLLYSLTSFLLSVFFMALGYNPIVSIFDSVSFVSNIGLSLGLVTVKSTAIVKIAGILGMWLGRLEFIPVIVLFIEIFNKIKIKRCG